MGSTAKTITSSVHFTAVLSDMDGTIFDSTAAVESHWTSIANELGIPPQSILATSHGRRSIDILKIHAPERATPEYVRHVEGLIPKLYADDAKILPGSADLIAALTSYGTPWAIVTSGTTVLVSSWMTVMNLPLPESLVTADDVVNGKPDPECYKLGLSRVFGVPVDSDEFEKLDKKNVVVLEDAPAGIRAGKDAGCTVIGLVTSHSREQVEAAGADWIVEDLSCVKALKGDANGITLEITGEQMSI